MTDRLADGYWPDWDIDSAVGHQGVLFVVDLGDALRDGRAEVKTDERARQTGRLYVEHACFRRGEWRDSGIVTTKAELLVYVVGSVVIAAPIEAWRSAHAWAIAHRLTAECARGSHPTKGALIPLARLVSLLMDGGPL